MEDKDCTTKSIAHPMIVFVDEIEAQNFVDKCPDGIRREYKEIWIKRFE